MWFPPHFQHNNCGTASAAISTPALQGLARADALLYRGELRVEYDRILRLFSLPIIRGGRRAGGLCQCTPINMVESHVTHMY